MNDDLTPQPANLDSPKDKGAAPHIETLAAETPHAEVLDAAPAADSLVDAPQIVARSASLWQPSDAVEDDAPQLSASEEIAPVLSTPAKIDLNGFRGGALDNSATEPFETSDAEFYDADFGNARHAPPPLDIELDSLEEPTVEPYEFAYDPPPPEGGDPFVAGDAAEEQGREKELDLMEHLGELRSRILRSFAAVIVAMIGTWYWRDWLLAYFANPIVKEVHRSGGTLITLNPAEGFTLYIQITFIAAIIIVIPVILYQLWAFIEPALTGQERRYGMIMLPFSVSLFFIGALFGFYLTPLFFRFFLQYQPPGTVATWSYAAAATMLAKMLLVFGICFQVPVVTVFVNKIGLVSRNWLIDYWRHVVVVIFLVVACITPTWDPVTLCAAAVPPCVLYGFSIWLVKWL